MQGIVDTPNEMAQPHCNHLPLNNLKSKFYHISDFVKNEYIFRLIHSHLICPANASQKMRLLYRGEDGNLCLTDKFLDEDDIPPYGIL
jgi:hypothetical protein